MLGTRLQSTSGCDDGGGLFYWVWEESGQISISYKWFLPPSIAIRGAGKAIVLCCQQSKINRKGRGSPN